MVTLWKLLLLLNSTADTSKAQEKITESLNTKEGILAQAQYTHTKNNLHDYNSVTEKDLNN